MTQQYPPSQPPPYGQPDPQQWQQYPPPPPAPKTPFWRTKKAAGLLLVGGLMAACGLAGGGTGQPTQNRPGVASGVSSNAQPAVQAPAQQAQSGPQSAFGVGTYEVGVDIVPGKYKTQGGGVGGSCYWARMKDTSGDLNGIIANGNTEGPATVTISKSDGAFQTTCDAWAKAG